MRFMLILSSLALALAAPAQEKVPTPPPGNYYLWYAPNATIKQRVGIVSFQADGKVALVKAAPTAPSLKLGTPQTVNGLMSLPITLGTNDLSFQAGPGPVEKGFIGSFGNNDIVLRAGLDPTDKTEITADEVTARDAPIPIVAETVKTLGEVRTLRQKAQREQDKAAQEKLTQEANTLQEKAEAKATAGLKEVAKTAGPNAAIAAEALVGQADQLTPEELAEFITIVANNSKRYGARFEASTITRLATTLAQTGPDKLALEYAKRASELPTLSTKNRQVALKILAQVQTKAGLKAEVEATQQEIAKLEPIVDAEYKKAVPPFPPVPYAGRKDKSADRVVVMELFTGAQCPPCVAADVAFDGLIQSYPATEVALLQYHMHIPGPDPLTNPDTIARFDYYAKLFENDFGGTPAAAFDGKPAAGGGGGMGQSKMKYEEFTELLNKQLEQKGAAKLAGTAKLAGDALTGTIEASVTEPKDTIKLRLVLAEDEVKYVGGNGLRFHHHVVRSLLGTAEGLPVKTLPSGKYELKADVAEIRTKLGDYLTKYKGARGGFPNESRPLDLKGLKLFALIQDDETGAILQAKQFDLTGK